MSSAAVAPSEAELESLLTSFDTHYVWDYSDLQTGLRDLYEKAKREQWNASDALAWETPVDPEAEIIPAAFNPLADYGPYKKLDARGVARFNHAQISWQLSQFMHGEQGALLTASQLVASVPWIDAKYYAASQTLDEARHVEVFSRYLRDKLEWEWPIDPHLKSLLDLILLDARWDLKYLGMLMRDRLVGDEVADAVGFDRDEVREILLASPLMQQFRQLLFARVVPNVKRLGLLTPRVRGAFEQMGILQFADADPEAQDRALGLA